MEFAGLPTWNRHPSIEIGDLSSIAVPQNYLNQSSLLHNRASSLIVIDPTVQNYQQLVAGVQPNSEVLILDPARDAIDQITQALLGQTGISSLHLVSHGKSGAIRLGDTWLDKTSLDRYQTEFQQWSKALTQDADILIYGCDVALGETGRTFINQFSQLTGADIAASTDLTGSLTLGGDWTLEAHTGTIETAIAFNYETLLDYHSILPVDLISVGNPTLVRGGVGLDNIERNAISGDGRYIVFTSSAILSANDVNGTTDVFLFDQQADTITLISRNIANTGSAAGTSLNPVISYDGNSVAFVSNANNLVGSMAGNSAQVNNIFVWERTSGGVTLVSSNTTGASGIADSAASSISDNGSVIAFQTRSQLLATDTNLRPDVYVWERNAGLTHISRNRTQEFSRTEGADSPVVSGDGRYVAFTSVSPNLTFGDINRAQDVFLWQRSNDTLTNLTVTSDGSSFSPVISVDGSRIAFSSDAITLTARDTNGASDIFVWTQSGFDAQGAAQGSIQLVSGNVAGDDTARSVGSFSGNSGLRSPVASRNGTTIAFASSAPDLVTGDTNNKIDIFVRNLITNQTVLVSRDNIGTIGNDDSSNPSLSADGTRVAFTSLATNLVAGDTNAQQDVFVRDLSIGTPNSEKTFLISRTSTSNVGNDLSGTVDGGVSGSLSVPMISGDGNTVAFVSLANNLSADDNNVLTDGFLIPVISGNATLISRRSTDPNLISRTGSGESTIAENSISASGRYLVFTSAAPEIVDGDTNGVADVFLRDRQTGTTTLISKGAAIANGASGNATISTDGRYIIFTSAASNLIAGDNNNAADIFWIDTQTQTLKLVSHAAGEATSANLSSGNAVLSANGLFVAFTSTASNLISEDTNSQQDVFVWNSQDDSISIVSRGLAPSDGISEKPVISSDGRYVAFISAATNLVTGDTNSQRDVFVWDQDSGTIALVSRADGENGAISNGDASELSLSQNGRTIAFTNTATNLITTPNSTSAQNVFVRNLDANTTVLASVNRSGGYGVSSGFSQLRAFNPKLSGDGLFVAFISDFGDLVPVDTNETTDVFLRDLANSTTTLISINQSGTDSGNNATGANGGTGSGAGTGSFYPAISNNGRYVAFNSFSSNLASGDTNNAVDVFVRDVIAGTTTLVSRIPSDTNSGNRASSNPVISSTGTYVAFNSVASDLSLRDLNGSIDVFGLSLGTIVSLSADKATTIEKASSMNYTVFRDKTAGELVVKLAIDPSSTASAADYGFTSNPSLNFTQTGSEITITLADGVATGVLTLTPIDDTLIEGDEIFNLSLSATQDYAIADSLGTTSLTIVDDDFPTSIGIRNITTDSTEGDTGEKLFSFEVKLSKPVTADPVTVQYATQNGTAGGTDFVATLGTLTFNVGESDTQVVTVEVKGDTQFEPDETFTVSLSNPSANALLATNSSTIATITNDDSAPIISISGATSITEGNSATQSYTFTVSLNEQSSTEIKVDYALVDTNTTSGSDYVTVPNGTLTFAPGITSQTITILVNGDALYEGDEQFQIALSNPIGAILPNVQRSITGTITNDDALPNITIETVQTQSESTGFYNFVVRLSEASALPVTVKYNTVAGNATAGEDFTAASNTLTFAPGETSQTIAIAVNNDTKREANETFSVQLADQTGAAITTTSAIAIIVDDDPIPTASIANVTQLEGNSGNTAFQFAVNLSNSSDQAITINYTTADGTATIADGDYQTASEQLTFAAGETTKTITVNAIGDTRRERDETFSVNLSSPNANVTVPTSAIGTGTIQNDDSTLPVISISPTTIVEGGVLSFTVSLSDVSPDEVRVNFATSDGTATINDSDYVQQSGLLVFAPNERTKTITVQTTADNKFESDQTINLTLVDPINATIDSQTAIGTITNDDLRPTFSIASTPLNEDDPRAAAYPFVVSLSNPSDQTITINYQTIDDTARVADGDYVAANGTVTFNLGEIEKTITVQANSDRKFEPDERFIVRLSNAINADLPTNATDSFGTLINDDLRPTISIANPTAIREGDIGTTLLQFTVQLSNPSSESISVQLVTRDGTATATDYVPTTTPTTITFAPGQTAQTITIPIVGDTRFEGDETFIVELSNPTNAASIVQGTATATILDNDPMPQLSIAAVPPTKPEGNSGITPFTFEISLNAASSLPVTVKYGTVDGTATIADNDYINASDTLTFAPGETRKTVTVNILGDTKYEDDETFVVALSNAIRATIQTNSATATIQGDDVQPNRDQTNSLYDILWRNQNTGATMLWQPSGALFDRETALITVPDPTWQLVGTGDFNNDGVTDLFWHRRITGETALWEMSPDSSVKSTFLSVTGSTWDFRGIADFNRDGNVDILWRNNQTGENAIWFMKGTTLDQVALAPTVSDLNWRISLIADFDNDGNADVFWTNSRTAETGMWLLDGATPKSARLLESLPELAWQPVGSGDFNRDGFVDIVWRNGRTGENALWLMQAGQIDRGLYIQPVPPGNWQIKQVADFNGDRNLDLLWQNTSTQEMVLWFMNQTTLATTASLPNLPDRNWSIAGIGKFDTQTKTGIVLRNSQTGENRIWQINPNVFNRTTMLDAQPDLDWQIQGTADFDRSGSADILWRNLRTNELSIWLTRNGQVTNKVAVPGGLQVPSGWAIRAIGDFSGDGSPDLIWSNQRTGEAAMWLFSGTALTAAFLLPDTGLNWQVQGVADMNRDRNLDIIWRNSVTGEIAYWLLDRTRLAQVAVSPVIELTWQIRGFADFDQDGQPDLVWRNTQTGDVVIWMMDGTQLNHSVVLPSPPLDWNVAGIGDYNQDGQFDLLWRNRLNGLNVVWYLKDGNFLLDDYIPSLSDPAWQVRSIDNF